MSGSFLIDPLLARHDCGVLGDGNVVENRLVEEREKFGGALR